MSDDKLFEKAKVSDLHEELIHALSKKSRSHAKVTIILKKLIANLILNNRDIAVLIPDIVRCLKIDNMEIQSMALKLIRNLSALNPGEATSALPFLTTLATDGSTNIRCMTIQTLCLVSNPQFITTAVKIVKLAMKDHEAKVRKSAAYAAANLFEHDPKLIEVASIVDGLNNLLYDSNMVVVSSALAALSFVTEKAPDLSLKIEKDHTTQLLGYLPQLNAWNQVYVLNAVMSYIPQTTQDALDLIEEVLPSLQHENSSVVINATKVIVYLSNYVRSPELIIPSLPSRLGLTLGSMLDKPVETQFLVLRNVAVLLLGRKELISVDVETFFCKFDDPVYIKDSKLELIYLLANEANAASVLRELEEYATEVDVAMARKAIRAFGNLAVKLRCVSEACVRILCNLMSHGINFIVQELVGVLKNIFRKYPGRFDFALQEIVEHYHLIDEPDALVAWIWIVGQYFEKIPSANLILKDLTDGFHEDPLNVQCAVLTAVVKCYLKSPSNTENLLVKVLKWVTEECDNPDLRDRGYFYWRLLTAELSAGNNSENQEHQKSIILNLNMEIYPENENLDPSTMRELELLLGLLATIYLKPIQSVFRFSVPRTLHFSDALQPQTPQYSFDLSFTREDKSNLESISYEPMTAHRRDSEGIFRYSSQLSSRRTLQSSPLPFELELSSKPKESISRRLTRKASMMLK